MKKKSLSEEGNLAPINYNQLKIGVADGKMNLTKVVAICTPAPIR